jgi:uncharacterized phiE125 gp8 family phage protein
MIVTQSSAPATEPITLSEAKLHLRLDSGTLSDTATSTQSILPGSHVVAANYTTHVGASVYVLGSQSLVYLNSGTNGAGGTVDCKIQESDDDILWTDWTGGAFTQVTEANDNAVQEKQYTGTKSYIRTVAMVLVADCTFETVVSVFSYTSNEDTLLTSIIQAAREQVEDITRRALITQTWDYYIDRFPNSNAFKLPFGNLQSVTHIKYTDSDGTQTTMTVSDEYIVETNGDKCGRIVLPYGESWPSFTAYPSNPIVIRFVCGWTSAAAIPEKIKSALKLILTDLYENRESQIISTTGSDYKINTALTKLLASYRLWDEVL